MNHYIQPYIRAVMMPISAKLIWSRPKSNLLSRLSLAGDVYQTRSYNGQGSLTDGMLNSGPVSGVSGST